MKKPTQILIAALATTALTGTAWAGGYHNSRHDYREFAKVVDVAPIYRQIEVSTPRQECWQEQVTREVPTRRASATPVILGGIIGGVIGNQIGGGRGRKLATVAGTMLGASIGADAARTDARYVSVTGTEQRCRTVQDSYTEQRVVGYQVKYRYRGRIYQTRMDHKPGDRIPLDVSVTPAY